jgi:hypothetical protein
MIQDLEAINEMVRAEGGRPAPRGGVGKRLRMDLGEGEEIPPTKVLVVPAAAPRTARMVEMLLGERTNT